jgi:hypothetical protein
MEQHLSEHTFKASDKDALASLKILMEFMTPGSLRKTLLTTFFAYLEEQANLTQDEKFKEIIQDYFFLFEFLDKLDSESDSTS